MAVNSSLLDAFHPAVASWFRQRFTRPTTAQAAAWPSIRSGRHTLVAAPTGSGKTLTAFLAAIDALVREGVAHGGTPLADATSVVYVSPLKALSNDIHVNLEEPLEGIRAELARLGLPDVAIRTAVRTGDTPQVERSALRKQPPHILVTTPESLYVLLGSASGREMLGGTRTVIVDEIHAIAGNKRGSHLALSLERLESLCGRRLLRIGLSATQKPIGTVGDFLVGARTSSILRKTSDNFSTGDSSTGRHSRHSGNDGQAVFSRGAEGKRTGAETDATLIDVGHARPRDLAIEVPPVPLEAVMSNDSWELVYDRLAQLVQEHHTTLVFVNTRRMAERAARHLSERLGKDVVAAHHGSLAKELRLDAEQRLKRGTLKVLVATASLELGIDIGEVDLVCQLGSPRSIAAFLQRAGRSGHHIDGISKARLFPATRDDLLECTALLDCVRRGELDALVVPPQPLDVLAQQIVAEVACAEWDEDALYALVCRAYPYRDLARSEFDAVVRMLAEGFTTRQGPRAAYIHRDAVNRQLRPRRSARLTALTSGGTIPDTADYKVVLEPQAIIVGTVNEDFAVESMAGDIFQLGNASYRIQRVERDRLRVEDARGAPPSIPFWLGEAPGRSNELSYGVSRLRETLSALLDPTLEPSPGEGRGGEGSKERAMAWLHDELGLAAAAARQLVDYLARAKAALDVLPSQNTLVLERFFDESGGTQLVLHAPWGSRINRAWGLALRKRFCRQFNFELQAAATEDAIVLSLSTSHSFPLEEVAHYLHSNTAEHVLVQALLDAPLFPARWRWNAVTALALPRFTSGKRTPPPLQRMKSEDLLAAVFPDQVACLENIAGERVVPDHPLVKQTMHDCLHEAMDLDGLLAILRRLEAGEIDVVARDLTAPSPLAAEVLNAAPYAFLDDAPLEERRTHAVQTRQWNGGDSADDLGRLDPEAITAVRDEAWPRVRDADEMHEALTLLGFLTAVEVAANTGWTEHLQVLAKARRATELFPLPWPQAVGEGGGEAAGSVAGLERRRTQPSPTTEPGKEAKAGHVWTAAETLPLWQALFPAASLLPPIAAPAEYAAQAWTREDALLELARRRLGGLGPLTADELARSIGVDVGEVERALLRLQSEGYVMQGCFSPGTGDTEWCERHLLARIHRYTIGRLRREIEPVSRRALMRFLFDWQHVSAAARRSGPDALVATLAQLEGYEAAAGAWESELLPARIDDYAIHWLDELCRAGRVGWNRLRAGSGGGGGPVRSTPIVLLPRREVGVWTAIAAGDPQENPLSSRAQAVADALREQGALFFDQLMSAAHLLHTELEEALGELVAAGRISADSFAGLRALLLPAAKRDGGRRRRVGRHQFTGIEDAGRWALARGMVATDGKPGPEAIEHVARTLLRRYGVVFWKLLEREAAWLPPWRDLLRVYHRLEARGEIRGGRFVEGLVGEQFAVPEAIAPLRAARSRVDDGELVCISGSDPLNLVGTVLVGDKVPALAGSRLLYRDGVAIAALVGGKAAPLVELPSREWQQARQALLRHAPASGAQYVIPAIPAGMGD
jgi:ATP-dependent Lhr-like helicase